MALFTRPDISTDVYIELMDEIKELHATAYREYRDMEPDLEIWLADAEGVWLFNERLMSARVSETGSELSNIKTIAEARASKYWSLFKDAMEEEIRGKMINCSWECVERPKAKKVLYLPRTRCGTTWRLRLGRTTWREKTPTRFR